MCKRSFLTLLPKDNVVIQPLLPPTPNALRLNLHFLSIYRTPSEHIPAFLLLCIVLKIWTYNFQFKIVCLFSFKWGRQEGRRVFQNCCSHFIFLSSFCNGARKEVVPVIRQKYIGAVSREHSRLILVINVNTAAIFRVMYGVPP